MLYSAKSYSYLQMYKILKREGLTFGRLSCISCGHVFIQLTRTAKASWSNAVMTNNLLAKCMVRKGKHSKLNESITRLLSAVFGNTSYDCHNWTERTQKIQERHIRTSLACYLVKPNPRMALQEDSDMKWFVDEKHFPEVQVIVDCEVYVRVCLRQSKLNVSTQL